MTAQLLTGALLLDPEASSLRVAHLLLDDGRIASVLEDGAALPEGPERIDLSGRLVSPGFIDVHFHGELLFVQPADCRDALSRAAERMLATGVTAFLPTSVAWPRAELLEYVHRIARLIDDGSGDGKGWGAQPLGLHLEGPWIDPGAAGAQPRQGIRAFDPAEGREIWARAEGLVRMVTLAPEVEGREALLEQLGERGIVPALGHTRSTGEDFEELIAAGARHVTHLFNAMGRTHHREPGFVGRTLTEDRLTCDLICDGVHVHPAMVRLAARAKGDRLMLITDRVEVPEGGASFGAGAVHDDGTSLRLDDGTLAGSTVTLDRALRNAIAQTGWSLLECIAAVTLRPARLLGLEHERGTLRPGARADLVILDEHTHVIETWVAGKRRFQR